MANPHRGSVALQAGDHAYTLSYSVNAICELEDHLGMPVAKIVNLMKDEENIRMATVRALIWGALRDHHEDIGLKGAGEIATTAGISACMEKVGKAFELAFPSEAKGKPRPPRAARAGE